MAQTTLMTAEVGREESVGLAARPAVMGGGPLLLVTSVTVAEAARAARELKQGVWWARGRVNL